MLKRDLRWDTEVAVFNGGLGALNCILQGLATSEDEVVLIEPTFNQYIPHV